MNIARGNNTVGLFMKTYAGVVITLLFFYYAFKEFNYNTKLLFKIYMWGAVLTSCVFLFQLFSYGIGFRPGYDLSYIGIRYILDAKDGYLPAGFGQEPSALSILGPACFVSINNILTGKRYFVSKVFSVLIIAVALL